MKLVHNSTVLGYITDLSTHDADMVGTFSALPPAERYRDFFNYMIDESNYDEEPPFSAELLSDEMWWIEDGGAVKPITMPAVYPNEDIYWRWR